MSNPKIEGYNHPLQGPSARRFVDDTALTIATITGGIDNPLNVESSDGQFTDDGWIHGVPNPVNDPFTGLPYDRHQYYCDREIVVAYGGETEGIKLTLWFEREAGDTILVPVTRPLVADGSATFQPGGSRIVRVTTDKAPGPGGQVTLTAGNTVCGRARGIIMLQAITGSVRGSQEPEVDGSAVAKPLFLSLGVNFMPIAGIPTGAVPNTAQVFW